MPPPFILLPSSSFNLHPLSPEPQPPLSSLQSLSSLSLPHSTSSTSKPSSSSPSSNNPHSSNLSSSSPASSTSGSAKTHLPLTPLLSSDDSSASSTTNWEEFDYPDDDHDPDSWRHTFESSLTNSTSDFLDSYDEDQLYFSGIRNMISAAPRPSFQFLSSLSSPQTLSLISYSPSPSSLPPRNLCPLFLLFRPRLPPLPLPIPTLIP